ncbi:MAG: hypothetical protein WAW80_04830 [Candidatus Saccharimonadales bacterium]
MKDKLKQHLKKFGPYWVILALSVLHLLLNWNRYFTLYDWADVDDTMQYNLSRSLSEGEWLGPYTRATLIKGIVFPLWTAGLHILNIPLWLGTSIAIILASLAVIYALRRLIENKWILTAIYGLLILNPMLTERVYRDYLLPAIALLLCAWAIGLFMTLLNARKNREVAIRDSIIFTVMGTIALPAWYHIREDSYWILPIVGGLFIAALISYLISVRWKILSHIKPLVGMLIIMIIPFSAVSIVGIGISSLNEKYYGRYTVNDYFSSDFADAYSALTRVNNSIDKELTVPVSTEMREKLYKSSPAFNELKPCLDAENGMGMCEGFKKNGLNATGINDYQGGWFPFALRLAVDQQGYYSSASKAENYYKKLAKQVNTACDKGELSCHEAHIVSLLPAPDIKIIGELLTNQSSSIWSMIFYLQSLNKDNDAPQNPSGPLNEMAGYYGVRYIRPSEYGFTGTLRNGISDFIWTSYKLINPLLMYTAIIVTLVATYLYFKREYRIDWKILVIAWLLMITIGVRLAMLAYVYTVHFPSTTNIYFAPIYVLLFLFEGISIYTFISLLKLKTKKKRKTITKRKDA